MGYRTLYGGELTITPPLTQSEHDRLLALCRLDNPRTKDVFASGIGQPTDKDREILGNLLKYPHQVLFYEWYIGPNRSMDCMPPSASWVVVPPDSEMSGGTGDIEDDLTFLHSWLKDNGHQLAEELSWSGSGNDDTGTIYVDPVHGVEAVEDIHDNPGPSWQRSMNEQMEGRSNRVQPVAGGLDQDSNTAEQFRQLAKDKHVREGTLEIDDGAIVSVSDDDGAYVAAWVWVDGVVCRTCGGVYQPFGDGYDGECPSCADKTAEALEAKEEAENLDCNQRQDARPERTVPDAQN